MSKIKVLVLDNDILARRAIAKTLTNDQNFEVKAGQQVEDIESIIISENPDVILMDLEQSAKNEFALFNTLRTQFPHLPIVGTMARSKEGAEAAIYALRRGAFDFVTKPENGSTLLFAGRHLNKRLPPIVKAAARSLTNPLLSHTISRERSLQHNFSLPAEKKEREDLKFSPNLVVIGACGGGPSALFSIFKDIPADLTVPIVIVQHFPRTFTRKLADELSKISGKSVQEVYDGAELNPGSIWIARGGFHCEIQPEGGRHLLRTHRGPRVNGVRPSIDTLFESAARLFGPGLLGVLLSGCGSDGIAGARTINTAGGKVIVQDPTDAPVPNLPMLIIRAGIADQCYPADKMGSEIADRCMKNKIRQPKKGHGLGHFRSSNHRFNDILNFQSL